jgi:hypothetical protein
VPPGGPAATGEYRLRTPEYAACRLAAAIESVAHTDAAKVYCQRQNELIMQQMDRRTCMYCDNTVRGMTNGMVNCA